TGDTNRPFQKGERNRCVEGEPQGCGESRKGPRMALVRRPSERRWSERTLRAAQGRMQGQAFLVTFFATEKSDSPSRAKPAPSSNSINDQERVTFIQQKNLPVR